MTDYKIINGEALTELQSLTEKPKLIFADPPDNLNLKYSGYVDHIDNSIYMQQLLRLRNLCASLADVSWISFYHKYMGLMLHDTIYSQANYRLFFWVFNFGQHRSTDFCNGFRPILRHITPKAKTYPEAVYVESERQRLGDKRANPDGRIPSDVWEFPRVCGNFKERRSWHPTQHPEALLERIIKFSTVEGDLVIDPYLGTGTTLRVCQRLNRRCYGIDISEYYCNKVSQETGVKIS